MGEEGERNPGVSAFTRLTGVCAGLFVIYREQCRPPSGKDVHRTGASWWQTGLPDVGKEPGMTAGTSELRVPESRLTGVS